MGRGGGGGGEGDGGGGGDDDDDDDDESEVLQPEPQDAETAKLRERVLSEPGRRLSAGWRARVETSMKKKRVRFFSPDGKRFGCAKDVVNFAETRPPGAPGVEAELWCDEEDDPADAEARRGVDELTRERLRALQPGDHRMDVELEEGAGGDRGGQAGRPARSLGKSHMTAGHISKCQMCPLGAGCMDASRCI